MWLVPLTVEVNATWLLSGDQTGYRLAESNVSLEPLFRGTLYSHKSLMPLRGSVRVVITEFPSAEMTGRSVIVSGTPSTPSRLPDRSNQVNCASSRFCET